MEELSLPKGSRRGLSDHVLDALRQSVMSGRFRPGEWLVESVLAEQMQVSRGPVREALNRLQQEGIVTAVPHKGTRVTMLVEKEIRELHTVRALLEGFAIRRVCAEDRRGPTVKRLQKILDQMRAAAAQADMVQFSQLDFKFHEEIMSATGMPRLYQLWSSMNGLLLIWLLSIRDTVRENLAEVLEEHLHLTQAIETGDEAKAEELLRCHILFQGEKLLSRTLEMEKEPPRAVPPRRRARRS